MEEHWEKWGNLIARLTVVDEDLAREADKVLSEVLEEERLAVLDHLVIGIYHDGVFPHIAAAVRSGAPVEIDECEHGFFNECAANLRAAGDEDGAKRFQDMSRIFFEVEAAQR